MGSGPGIPLVIFSGREKTAWKYWRVAPLACESSGRIGPVTTCPPVMMVGETIDTAPSLQGEERRQTGMVGSDEIPEDVDVDVIEDGGDFDARDELDACVRACGSSGRRGCGRVVIGDAQDVDAGRRSTSHKLCRRASAVGCRRVGVEVDHRRGFDDGFFAARAPFDVFD